MTATRNDSARAPQWLAIGLVCMAGLLLEVAFTRIISYKLWYYYTYLVIGLSLLGIGSGGIIVAVVRPLQRAATARVVALSSLLGAVGIAASYLVIARLSIDTVAIWDYGTRASLKNILMLGVMCLVLFAPFIALGVVISTILGRSGENIGRLYFADLLGAGLGCVLAIPLISILSPPQVVALAAFLFAVVAIISLPPRLSPAMVASGLVALVLVAGFTSEDRLPSVRVESTKQDSRGALYSDWGPVFRVDVMGVPNPANRLLVHDGSHGSSIWSFDGDLDTLGRYDTDSRAIPFDVLGRPPDTQLIIGSAGGQEILASLHRDAESIEAVELNPVTVGLLTDEFADYTGHLPDRPEVHLHQGDGRTYLARSETDYDLVWFVAPDSYAANNAASSGAFVLSESYLYTKNMIEETLERLTDDGVMVVQFGELTFEGAPNRTSRYVVTARAALEAIGVDDPPAHMLVSAEINDAADLSTIVLKRTPFTQEEIDGFLAGLGDIVPAQTLIHAPGEDSGDHVVSRLARGTAAEVDAIVASSDRQIGVITDDGPFFWHFTSFRDVLTDLTRPINVLDPEDSIGERVMLLLLGVAILFAASFLLLPFLFVRTTWTVLPAKGVSALYFACLGMGFMLFEITMIQRLVRFLGYPTYSLTVTLASILVFTGLGALVSKRVEQRGASMLPLLFAVLAVLTLLYQFGLDSLTDSLQSAALGVRVIVAAAVLAPLGLCLGMFMPFGLRIISRTGPFGEEYVAWSWAVNGFFSVIGSVLTTILSMEFGFRNVQYLALLIYGVAVLAFLRLRRAVEEAPAVAAPTGDDDDIPGERLEPAAV